MLGTMYRACAFLAGSAGIVILSWRSLRVPRSHGFFRFFAFELLLLLVVLNTPAWLREPFSARQIVSWLLLSASAGLAIEAFRLLKEEGKPAPAANAGANLPFENTTVLVTRGIYRFVRHPMYASLLALGWGTCLKNPSPLSIVLAAGATGRLTATAITEERENSDRFGEAYASYARRTKRFVPFVF
jgi:protein-S-isoprenylcysteine O-methyltransferase Ste14